MHYLSKMHVENFRSCMSCTLPLFRFTPMVGYNNGGKSNLIAAMKWLLRRSTLQRSDFLDPDRSVIVTGTIEGISDEVLARLEGRHRSRIEPMIVDGLLRIRRTQPSPGGGVGQIKLDVYDPRENGGDWRDNPTGIDAAITALFPEPIHIGAMEDAAEDVGKSKTSTTIGKLIAELTAPIEERHGGAITAALEAVRDLLEADGQERAPELAEFDNQANEILQTFFPGVRIAVHVPPPEVVELLKGGTIRVFEGDEGAGREVSSMGHGAQRSIQMALVRYLAERRAHEGSAATTTLLLIDEPELYLHPKGIEVVREALERLSEGGYQVVFSTHSPQMVQMGRMADTLIVRKEMERGTFSLPTLRDAVGSTISDASHQAEVLFEFQNAAQVLFADRVVLMEGKTERRLLPLICKLEGHIPPSDGSIALVSVRGSGNVPKALAVLRAMGIPAHAVVDLDFAFTEAVRGGWIDSEAEALRKCHEVLARLQEQGEVELAANGLPRGSANGSAEDGFALLAAQEDAGEAIEELHRELKAHDVWMWRRGSFEHHLGIEGKGGGTLGRLVAELKEKGCEAAIDDWQGVRELVESVCA